MFACFHCHAIADVATERLNSTVICLQNTVLCVHYFDLMLLLKSICCRLKVAEAKLEEAIKSVTEEIEQYVLVTNVTK